MRQDDYEFVIGMLNRISEEIKVGNSKKYLKDLILEGYDPKYVNRYFEKVVGCSFDYYIRIFYYLTYLRDWKKYSKQLAQRNSYKGFNDFGYYFKRTFGIELKEADIGELINNAKMGEEGLMRLRDKFIEMQYFTGFWFKNDEFSVNLTQLKFLEIILSEKTFFIPKKLMKENNADLGHIEMEKVLLNIYGEEFEDYEKDLGRLGVYSLEESVEYGDWCVWHGNIPVEFDRWLERVLWECQERIVITYPEDMSLSKEYDILKDYFENEYSKYNSLVPLEKRMGICDNEILEILAHMAKRGLVRLRRGVEMNIEKESIEKILEEEFERTGMLDEKYEEEHYADDFIVCIQEMIIEQKNDDVAVINGVGIVFYDIFEKYWAGDYDDEGNCWKSQEIGEDRYSFKFEMEIMGEEHDEILTDVELLEYYPSL